MFDEPLEEAWRLRYGTGVPPEGDAEFLRHRSVRKYAELPVSKQTISWLIGCAQSAATSSNLQMWSVISVQEPERRAEIAKLCADQKHVLEAPWFLAFIADHHRLARAGAAVGESCAGLDYNEFFTMALVDVALAAERLVCAAESIGLGICYIGALRNDPEGVRKLLELPKQTFGVFGLCIGYPAPGIRAKIKPRLAQNAVWYEETYRTDTDVSEYDERMPTFYESQQMSGDASWSMRSGRRVDEHHLTGREVLKPWLESQGFDRR